MKHVTRIAFIFSLLFVEALSIQGQAPVCHSFTPGNSSYNQDFDTLAATGTSSTVPAGFGFAETGSNADTLYNTGTGSLATGNTYSFGSASTDSDRAFGGLLSGTLVPTIGACFTNNTGETITSFAVTYDGEMWRLGDISGRLDRLDFQYSLDATTLLNGTWADVNDLDFVTPNTAGAVGFRDGNDPAFRTPGISAISPDLSIPDGATWYIRYSDSNATGSDDGLAIDNFSMVVGAGSTSAPVAVSGRVISANGRSISGARITIEGGNMKEPLSALTSPFGYFRFDGLTVGETYIVTIGSKRFVFAEPVRVITPDDNISDLDFVALP